MKSLAIRLLKRCPFIISGILMFLYCMERTEGHTMLGAFGWALIGLAFLITTAIIVAYPMAYFLGDMGAGLFVPSATVVPPPLYYLIEKYIEEGRYEEAEEEYRKIVYYHPRELRAYTEWMTLRSIYWPDRNVMEKVFKDGIRQLKKEQDILSLKQQYDHCLSQFRVNTDPELS